MISFREREGGRKGGGKEGREGGREIILITYDTNTHNDDPL